MKSKTLLALAACTAAFTAAAVVTMNSRDKAVQGQAAGTPLFPELKRSLNEAAKVTIRRADGTAVLEKSGEGWGLADKGGYPIEMEPVRKALITLSEMQTVEAKTASPEQYARLGVEDVTAPGAQSAHLTVQDASGRTLAELIVGKTYESKNYSAEGQCYVRKPGESQSWLVKGRLDLRDNGPAWLAKKIVELKRDRIREVEVKHPDGESVRVDRASAELTDFTLANIPEGKELQYATAPGTLASALEYVNLEDVQPAGGVDFAQDPGPLSTFRTFDGLRLDVACKELDGKTYARFSASFEEPAAAPDLGPQPEKPADATGTTPKPAVKTPEEVKREVEELNARFSKWTYVISSYNRSAFYKRSTDLLKDKAPPTPPPSSNVNPDETYKIQGELPAEIQDQIKKDLDAKGQKWEVVPATAPIDGGHDGHDHGTPPPAPAGGTPPH